ncbi:uncharacterized protein LOC127253873 [Andrographis paniculata]|uniref:uncharacterized protein LOC127253873 n=1 Tax=Andrographis paniculata TaxID=175694 RepID=UPI0021E74B23|nr:uncharacterized protein LOC127253873 [Andrographis paniculata]
MSGGGAGAVETVDLELTNDLAIRDETNVEEVSQGGNDANSHSFCAICLNKIVLQDIALVKGCEHSYCINCILRWASCKKNPTCPQCKCPFEFLNIHRGLDGRIHDYMFEESVCLLLRASWFKPVVELEQEETAAAAAAASSAMDDMEDYYYDLYEDELDSNVGDIYLLRRSPGLRIGNRRWGDNGYVRAGRQEARPVVRSTSPDPTSAGSSQPNKQTTSKEVVGRRAKRALKREAADKAAAAKHQQHLARFGRK